MQITYNVHNVSPQPRASVGTVEGVTLAVMVPEIEVELSDPTNQHGSVTLHFRTPEEKEYAKTVFSGKTVTLTLPELPAPPPEPTPEPAPEPAPVG